MLHRRVRDADTHEVLGGIGSPLVRVSGDAQLVLGAKAGHALIPMALQDELAFVREEALLGFELRLAYENGRLALEPAGEGGRAASEGAHVVQLRGRGALVARAAGELASAAVRAGPRAARAPRVDRGLARAAGAARAPAHRVAQRVSGGLIAFSGEGTVLVCAG